MGFDNAMWHFDEGVTGLFGQWNAYTSFMVTVLLGIVSYALFNRQDPDTHPMLLARQATGSPVRQEGESAIYRSHASPHGMPLNSGLGVRDPGASKWSRGRDGDLRDIWRRAVSGAPEGEGPPGTGRLLTVMGTERVIEHDLASVTRQINLIGQHLLDQGANRVAIYLPNSVELLATLFACAFHNLTAVVLPFAQSDDAVISMLRRSAADAVVTLPGHFPFDSIVRHYPALRQLVWVVDQGSRHMDWNEVPEGTGGSVNVATWQDIIADAPADAGKDLPPFENQPEARDVTIFWEAKAGEMEEMVRFTAANIIAAIAAQIFAIPSNQRMSPSDLFLPADSLANTHTLVMTLAALYSNASVALNSASAGAPTLARAMQGVAPTVVCTTARALLASHADAARRIVSFLPARLHAAQTHTLTRGGAMPSAASSLAARLGDALSPPSADAAKPGKLRLLFVAERAGSGSPPVSAAVLSDMRVFTRARVIYALTAPKVAGAVAQTGFYDYRVAPGQGCSHFGAPLTSCEVLLRDKGTYKTTDDKMEGEVSTFLGVIPEAKGLTVSRLSSVGLVLRAARRRLASSEQFAMTTHSRMPDLCRVVTWLRVICMLTGVKDTAMMIQLHRDVSGGLFALDSIAFQRYNYNEYMIKKKP
jgi:hypothetical protein